MTVTINGTTGITTPAVTNEGAYTGDGVVFADSTPSNTLVTNTSGNIGVGTSSPVGKLNVHGGSGNSKVKLSNNASGNGSGDGFDLDFTGTDIYITNRENGFMAFENNGAERMRIDSSGNLLVGTTSADGKLNVSYPSGGNGCKFVLTNSSAANNVIVFNNTNGTVGYIQMNGSNTSYNTSSDYRLKENIAPMTGALATVQALKPCTYTWKADGSDGQGFIAHELQEVVPDCVTGEKDAVDAEGNIKPQAIDTSFLVATLTAAIQEQQAIITDLKSRIEALEQA